ncbi:MAG: LPS-assembly protein LptD [Acidobacteria bacterium]|nr:MAG: LPS-assembly protein LptD [Acidobacteriota bacterium]
MISRTRFLITTVFFCHLLLTPTLVTSQLLLPVAGRDLQNEQQDTKPPDALPGAPSGNDEEITIRAAEQQKDGPVFKLRGQVEIHYRTFVLYADEITYNSATGDATLEGHVVLDGGPNDEHIQAGHGRYNIRTEVGRFYDVIGTTGLRLRGGHTLLTSSTPFAFTGKLVEKTGPDHYVVHDGTVTTCELPKPKWIFSARKVVVDVGGNAKIYHSTFRIKGVPIFYFPFATHPVEHLGRQSGFLIPNFGNSSRKGFIAGESVYWAIDRSMDATVGADYYSLRGWAQHGEFRARPSETSFVDLNYQGVIDRGIGSPPVKQGGENARLNAQATFGHNFRGVANIDYLSSFVYRLAFNEVFTQAVYSEVKSQVFLSNTTRGFSYNGMTERYQNFESTQPGDVITILHAPSFDFSSVEKPIAHSPLYGALDFAAEGLSRSEPSFRTANLLGRVDLNPSISLPLRFDSWSLRPELSLRDTYYTQRLVPTSGTGFATSEPINRRALDASVELRPPALARIFDREVRKRKLKHVIEPRLIYTYTTGVDNFSQILRFDERDILSNTNEVEYAVVNRLYAKRTSDQPDDCGPQGMPALNVGAGAPQGGVPWSRGGVESQPCVAGPRVREIITWELKQKYFFDPNFGGALVAGLRNVFTTSAELTGIAFLTEPRRFSPLVSRLRIQTSARSDAEWDADYDFKNSRINASTVLLNYHFGSFTMGGGDAYSQVPDVTSSASPVPTLQEFHQFRVLLGYGHPNKRGFSGAASFGFDATLGFLQYSTVQTSYNWDCCGLSLEYRRFALGSVRNENQFRFNFSLANVATFGNLRRQERLF